MPEYIYYKIVSKNDNIKDCYVGKTTNFRKRVKEHKNNCNNKNRKCYNLKLYEFIRENKGWDNFDMIEIEKGEYDKKDSAIRERYWFEELNATLNSLIPSRTREEFKKEYYDKNREIINEKHKEYYEKNKKIMNEKQKEYYEKNKEIINEKHKEYYENNKEILSEKYKNYYEKNKEILSQKAKKKITCQCGCEIRKDSLSKHLKSKKHIKLMS